MDEMKLKLSTKFMKNMVAKIISKAIYKKLGFKPNIQFNELAIDTENDKIYFHIDVDGHISKSDLLKVSRLADLEDETE